MRINGFKVIGTERIVIKNPMHMGSGEQAALIIQRVLVHTAAMDFIAADPCV